jgi:hypothetical protein
MSKRAFFAVLAMSLFGCSSPTQTTSHPGIVLQASRGEDAISIANTGARIAFASGPSVTDMNAAIATTGGTIFTPVSVTYVDGGVTADTGSLYLCDDTLGITTVNLPLADAGAGRTIRVIKVNGGANGCLVKVAGTDKVLGTGYVNVSTVGLPDAGSSISVASDGVNRWLVLGAQ